MKKGLNFIFYAFFTLVYGGAFSLGMTCLGHLLGIAMAMALDGESVIRQYPRFIPFCIILGALCLIALIALAVLNVKFSEKLNYTKPVWIIQFVCAAVLSVPMMKIWSMTFDFLRKTL